MNFGFVLHKIISSNSWACKTNGRNMSKPKQHANKNKNGRGPKLGNEKRNTKRLGS